MAVYILHAEEKLSNHAGHYCGFTDDLPTRIACHEHGNSAKLVAAWSRNGIRFVLAWVDLDGDRELERKIKKQKNVPRSYCPICRGLTHKGYSIDLKQLLFQKSPPALDSHQGKRRPMYNTSPSVFVRRAD